MSKKYSKFTKMWADMGYLSNELKEYIKQHYNIDLEIVKRPPCRFWVHKDIPIEALPVRESGFKVEPRGWGVERTFAWIGRNRRLSKESIASVYFRSSIFAIAAINFAKQS